MNDSERYTDTSTEKDTMTQIHVLAIRLIDAYITAQKNEQKQTQKDSRRLRQSGHVIIYDMTAKCKISFKNF